MFTKIHSFGILGLDAYPVTIEVDVSHGLPATVIVGLPDNAIKESKERIRSAIKNSGFKFPPERITINLSPADTKKEGPAFDLAMALGLLAASEQIDTTILKKFIILGELSLDGKIQTVNGILPITLSVSPRRFQGIILPEANAWEASLAERLAVYPARNLLEAIHILSNGSTIRPFKKISVPSCEPHTQSGIV